jgi:uncharacterized protein (DUF2225 family)
MNCSVCNAQVDDLEFYPSAELPGLKTGKAVNVRLVTTENLNPNVEAVLCKSCLYAAVHSLDELLKDQSQWQISGKNPSSESSGS